MNAQLTWQSVLAQLQMEMPRASFDTWVRDTRPLALDGSFITVGVRNAYARDWLENRLTGNVNKILLDVLNASVAVKFTVSQTDDAASTTDPELVSPALKTVERESKPRHVILNPRYTFDTFVVGSGNRLANAACQAVAEKPARAYNPLFLYGGVGLGKTHLLQAIGNSCHARGLNVLYVSSEEFTNDMINAIRTHTTQAFRDKYRSADVLLVDDIQFIAGKESTQEEFFHTFNKLHGQEKQIIVSSDRPPKSLITLEERLRSRFEWGLTADIQAPDFETRLAILRSKAERTRRQISDEILESVAKQVQSNIRELEGALNRIIAFADLSSSALTPSLVEVALADFMPVRGGAVPDVIVRQVADHFKLSVDKLLGRDRTKEVARSRQIAMYLLREDARISFPQIGEVLGGRDHSTVMSAIDKIKDQYESGEDHVRKDIDSLRQKIYSQPAMS